MRKFQEAHRAALRSRVAFYILTMGTVGVAAYWRVRNVIDDLRGARATEAALRALLDAAYEAASVDCHINDKARLQAAIIAYEQAAGIACRSCSRVECPREYSEDGDAACVFGAEGPW